MLVGEDHGLYPVAEAELGEHPGDALALTFSAHRILARLGVILLAIYGAGFAIGEISELFQHNVGISPPAGTSCSPAR